MAYEQKDMDGVLFRNDKRDKEGQPHATGHATIGGRKVWISAWTNDGPKGKYQKLSFKWADEQAGKIRDAYEDASGPDDADDLPF